MFKKNAFEKRLRKISKQEAANVRLLEKQVQQVTVIKRYNNICLGA